jgi:prevent-host-death family protein
VKAEKVVSVSEFKAKCLRLIDDVASGSELTISKRGKPVARLVRIDARDGDGSYGVWKSELRVSGDLVHPGWDDVFTFE